MNKPASIQKILGINKHPNADTLDIAKIQGYQVVVKSNQFKVNDLVVFIEPDSVCPSADARFNFLEKNHFRVKLIRLRKEVSMGVVMPISEFPELNSIEIIEDLDISELIGVKHYVKEIPAQLAGVMRGNFPGFLRKTDEDNIRSKMRVLSELQGLESVITCKLDGCSGSFAVKDNDFRVCSRNIDLIEDEFNVYWKAARRYDLLNKLKSLEYNIAIQGEVYGNGIQGNKMGAEDVNFAAFNLFDIDKQKFYNYDEMEIICKDLEIPMVPLIWRGIFNFTLEELMELAKKQLYANGSPAEGIVIRPVIETYSECLRGRLSGKIISEVFLEKYKE